MKVSKEEIIGFLTALELFVEEDEEVEMSRLRRMAQRVVDALIEIPGLRVSVEHDQYDYLMPTAVLKLGPDWTGPPKDELMSALEQGDPPVFLQGTFLPEEETAVDPFNLSEEELPILIDRLREELLRHPA